MKMFGKLLGSEEINATMVMALSGTLMMLVAKGDGPVSLKRLVSETLSNPVPRREVAVMNDTSVLLHPTHLRAAA
jgi:hypothetical protein